MSVSGRRAVLADGCRYIVVDDRALDLQALITGQALDELTKRPPLERVSIAVALRGISPLLTGRQGRFTVVAGSGGTFAVAGVADVAFPNLAATSYTVDLTVTAPGYLDTPVSVDVPAGTASFPLPALSAPLRRPAVRLRGRVMTSGSSPSPVNGALIEVVAPVGLLGFEAPLAFVHDAAAHVVPLTLTPAAPDLDLLVDALPGDTRLALLRRTGLAVNAVIRLGSGGAREYTAIESIGEPSDLDQPGVVTLRAPLIFTHRVAETAPRRVAVPPLGAGTPLSHRAFPGDQVIFVNDATLFLTDGAFVIDDLAVERREYRVAAPLSDIADADGYYRIGPVGRSQMLTVRVTPPASPPEPNVVITLDYTQPVNELNLRG